MKTGAYLALCGMLTTLLGALAGLRYWFLVSRLLGEHEENPAPLHFAIVFWVIFAAGAYVALRFRRNYAEGFENSSPELVDRLLGCVFGAASGIVIVSLLMMTLSVAAPQIWPSYRSDQLPLPVDHWPLDAYRFIETRFAGIGAGEPGHTPLPALSGKVPGTPAEIWR
jgi:hypothetical protein